MKLLSAILAAASMLIGLDVLAQVEVEKAVIELDASQELRFKEMLPNLRCLVCQNESLADSQAPLAVDLRYEIRGLLKAGRSDEEIRRYLTDRYGEFVLYNPRFTPRNWLLWLGPFVLALGGMLAVTWFAFCSRRTAADSQQPLDKAALRRLLEEEPPTRSK